MKEQLKANLEYVVAYLGILSAIMSILFMILTIYSLATLFLGSGYMEDFSQDDIYKGVYVSVVGLFISVMIFYITSKIPISKINQPAIS